MYWPTNITHSMVHCGLLDFHFWCRFSTSGNWHKGWLKERPNFSRFYQPGFGPNHIGSKSKIWDKRLSQKHNCIICLWMFYKTNGTNERVVVPQGFIFALKKKILFYLKIRGNPNIYWFFIDFLNMCTISLTNSTYDSSMSFWSIN